MKKFVHTIVSAATVLLVPQMHAQNLTNGQWTTIPVHPGDQFIPSFQVPTGQGLLTFEVKNVKMRDVQTGTQVSWSYNILAAIGTIPTTTTQRYTQYGAAGFGATLRITSPPSGQYLIQLCAACSGCNFVVVSYDIRPQYSQRPPSKGTQP